MRALNDERGAVAVLVSLSMVVLIGFVALAVDVSSLYQERRELQNGADAGALGVAKDCAKTACDIAKANTYADANADDANSNIDEVCGTGPGLPACATPPSSIPAGGKYVKVTTSTASTGAQPSKINFLFAPVLDTVDPGNAAQHRGQTVRASAVVAYGSPGGASTLPLTFSNCEYRKFVPTPASLETGPPWSLPEQVVSFHGDTSQAGSCGGGPSGLNLPGGFGWLAPGAGCVVTVTLGGPDPGSSTGTPAPSCVDMTQFQNKTVLLPIYDRDAGTGAGGTYHILGFAAFYLTGYRFTGQDKWPTGITCPGGSNVTCIKGHFTKLATTGTVLGGPDMGVTIFKIVG